MRIHIRFFPPDIIAHYKLNELVDKDGWIYIEIIQGMYGLPQAGILTKNLLLHRLYNHRYYQVKLTLGLWIHVWRTNYFKLVVNDFGIGYVRRDHADNLMIVLKIYYKNITTDLEGNVYCGITMKWNYTKMHVDISIPVYVKEDLQKIGHKTQIKPQNQPYPVPKRTYGADAQKMKPLDTSPALPMERVKRIEHIIGKLLYCATGVDNMYLVPLNTTTTKNYPTEQYEKNVHQFLDYMEK